VTLKKNSTPASPKYSTLENLSKTTGLEYLWKANTPGHLAEPLSDALKESLTLCNNHQSRDRSPFYTTKNHIFRI